MDVVGGGGGARRARGVSSSSESSIQMISGTCRGAATAGAGAGEGASGEEEEEEEEEEADDAPLDSDVSESNADSTVIFSMRSVFLREEILLTREGPSAV